MPATNDQEKLVIQRAQQGDAEAMVTIYQTYAPAVFRYFFFRVSDEATAEDLTSEVFAQIIAALQHYQERGFPFGAWLFQIAHSRLVDYHRIAARRRAHFLSEEIPDRTPDPETQVADRANARHLHQAIHSLTDDQRLVIQFRFMEDYSLEDTARLMQKTVGAVKSLQHRALRNLARELRPAKTHQPAAFPLLEE